MKKTTETRGSMIWTLFLGIILLAVPVLAADWGWKKATDPTDVMNFLNAKPPYTQHIADAAITVVDNGSFLEFIVFYFTGPAVRSSGGWGWKKASDPGDVQNFLSGRGAYHDPVRRAKVAAAWRKTYTEYYVFYQR